MLSTDEIDRLAAAIHAMRPDWLEPSLRTFIRNRLPNRTYREVAQAFAQIATDPETRSINRILNDGPWWPEHRQPKPSGGSGDWGGAKCRCGKTLALHNAAESKVPEWARHPFETEDEHLNKVWHEQRRNEDAA